MKNKINRFVEKQWDKDGCYDLVVGGLCLALLAAIAAMIFAICYRILQNMGFILN